MKNLLKKWLGLERYCRTFHSAYGVGKKKKNLYYCPKCNITQIRHDHDNTGPL